jgi:hypothetical protein
MGSRVDFIQACTFRRMVFLRKATEQDVNEMTASVVAAHHNPAKAVPLKAGINLRVGMNYGSSLADSATKLTPGSRRQVRQILFRIMASRPKIGIVEELP